MYTKNYLVKTYSIYLTEDFKRKKKNKLLFLNLIVGSKYLIRQSLSFLALKVLEPAKAYFLL